MPRSDEMRRLRHALLSAFPRRDDLARLVSFGLDHRLEEISGAGNQAGAVFELIRWAEATGRIPDLIRAALDANPGNPELRAVANEAGELLRRESNLSPAGLDAVVGVGPSMPGAGGLLYEQSSGQ